MHAVIRTGGKQYYVTAGDILEVEKLTGEVGDIITIDDILMVANDEDVTVGQPIVGEAAVTARITGQYRGTKILVFRYRPKKRIRVRRGHRQYLTRLEIQSVKFGEHEFTAPAAVVVQKPVAVEAAAEPQVEEVPMTPYVAATEVSAVDSAAAVAANEAQLDMAATAPTESIDVDVTANTPETDTGEESAKS